MFKNVKNLTIMVMTIIAAMVAGKTTVFAEDINAEMTKETTETDKAKAEQNLQDALEDLKDASEEKADAEENVSEKTEERDTAQGEYQTALDQVSTAEQEAEDAFSQAVTDAEDSVSAAEGTIQDLNDEISETEQNIEDLAGQTEEADKETERLQEELDQAEENADVTKEEYDTAVSDIETAEQAVADQQDKIDQLEEEAENIDGEIADLEESADAAEQSMNDAGTNVEEAETAAQTAEENWQDLDQKTSDIENGLGEGNEEYDRLSQAVEEANQAVDDAETALGEAEGGLEAAKEVSDQAAQAVTDAENGLADTEKNATKENDALTESMNETAEAERLAEAAAAEAERLSAELDRLEEELAKAEQVRDEAVRQYEELLNSGGYTEEDKAALEAEIAQLQQDLTAAEKAVEDAGYTRVRIYGGASDTPVPDDELQVFIPDLSEAEGKPVTWYYIGTGGITSAQSYYMQQLRNNGMIVPRMITKYVINKGSYNWIISSIPDEGDKVVNVYDEADEAVLKCYAAWDGGKKYFEIKVEDYAQIYYQNDLDQKENDIISRIITDDMTDYEKIVAIARHVGNEYRYDANYHTAYSMINNGGGSCWSSASLVVDLAEKVGLEAALHAAQYENPGSDHRNAVVCADGKIYEVEAGYVREKNENKYSVYEFKDGFFRKGVDGGIMIESCAIFNQPVIVIPDTLSNLPVVQIGDDSSTYFRSVFNFTSNNQARRVVIPETVTSISESAFYGSGITEIVGKKGSYAEQYALAHGMTFYDIDGEVPELVILEPEIEVDRYAPRTKEEIAADVVKAQSERDNISETLSAKQALLASYKNNDRAAAVTAAKKLADTKQAAVDSLKAEISSTNTQIKAAQDHLSAQNQAVADAKAKEEAQRAVLADAQKEVQKAETALNEARDKAAAAVNAYNQAAAEVNKAQQNLTEKRTAKQDAEAAFEAQFEEAMKARKEATDALQVYEDAKSALQTAKDTYEAEKQKYQEAAEAVQKAGERKEGILSELAESRNTLQGLKEELDAAVLAKAEIEEKYQQIKDAAEALDQAKAYADSLREEMQKAEAGRQEAVEKLAEAKAELAEAKADLEYAKTLVFRGADTDEVEAGRFAYLNDYTEVIRTAMKKAEEKSAQLSEAEDALKAAEEDLSVKQENYEAARDRVLGAQSDLADKSAAYDLYHQVFGIMGGSNLNWRIGEDNTMLVEIDAEVEDFLSVTVDGKPVPIADFTVTRGSTVIRLSDSFLSGLSVGAHRMHVDFANGSAETWFWIHEENKAVQASAEPQMTYVSAGAHSTPNTSDTSDAMLYAMELIASAGAAVFVLNKKRKDQMEI